MLNEGATLAERPAPALPRTARLLPDGPSDSTPPSQRLLADALDSLAWLTSSAIAFAFAVDERSTIEVRMLHCERGRDRREVAELIARLRELEAIDPFSPRRASACRATVMSLEEVGGPEAYARSMFGERLRRHGYNAPIAVYLWRGGRIVAGVTLLRGCTAAPFDAGTVQLVRELQPLLEDAFGFATEPPPAPSPAEPLVATLTERERQVAGLVAAGESNAEIASTLHVSEVTVKAHLTKIYAKLGVRSRTQLAVAMGHAA